MARRPDACEETDESAMGALPHVFNPPDCFTLKFLGVS
jgi:hypothetical protein